MSAVASREIIAKVSNKLGVSRGTVRTIFDAIINEIKAELVRGNSVRIPRFIIMEPKKAKAPNGKEYVKLRVKRSVILKRLMNP